MSNYNQKLFSGGLRSKLHYLRFHWLKRQITEAEDAYTLFELGCFDCRSLKFLPKPKRYVGADAGWEGGLDDARMTFLNRPWMELVMTQSVHDLAAYENQQFDYCIALETLEHIPNAVLSGYVEFLARVTKKQLIVSVPVEIGPLFLAKFLAKKLLPNLASGETDSYTFREVIWQTLGRTEKVERYEHKGFNYRTLITFLEKHFDIVKVEGLPLKGLPYFSFQVGIVATPKAPPLVGEIL